MTGAGAAVPVAEAADAVPGMRAAMVRVNACIPLALSAGYRRNVLADANELAREFGYDAACRYEFSGLPALADAARADAGQADAGKADAGKAGGPHGRRRQAPLRGATGHGGPIVGDGTMRPIAFIGAGRAAAPGGAAMRDRGGRPGPREVPCPRPVRGTEGERAPCGA